MSVANRSAAFFADFVVQALAQDFCAKKMAVLPEDIDAVFRHEAPLPHLNSHRRMTPNECPVCPLVYLTVRIGPAPTEISVIKRGPAKRGPALIPGTIPVDARFFHPLESANLLLAKTGGTSMRYLKLVILVLAYALISPAFAQTCCPRWLRARGQSVRDRRSAVDQMHSYRLRPGFSKAVRRVLCP